MIGRDEAAGLPGTEVYDDAGERVGTVTEVFVEPRGGEPQWVTVRTGTFGFQQSFVPLAGARLAGDRLTVAVPGDRIRQAPLLDADAPLLAEHTERLESHYGLGSPTGGATDDAMTRSEERLVTSTREEPVEKVRLRKYLVTEERQITVPVTREEVRLERVPVTEPEPDARSGAGVDEPGPDVVLHAQQPVVSMESVPVERVRLSKETVQGTETVSGDVRRERIEYEGPGDPDQR